MKKIVIIFFLPIPILAMEEPERTSTTNHKSLPRWIAKKDVHNICTFLAHDQHPARNRLTQEQEQQISQEKQEARNVAQANLETAQAQLTWKGNTARRGKLAGGLFSLVISISMGLYHLILFDNEATEKISNSFNVLTDLSLACNGMYLVKNALENTAAHSEYNQAYLMHFLIEQSCNQRPHNDLAIFEQEM